jgi:hypothetical protein
MVATLLSGPQVPKATAPAAPTTERETPATRTSRKLFALVEQIDTTLTQTKYQHRTQVKRRDGVYLWDCSGMMNWMLKRVAPRAREALDRDRPVARTYHRVIKKAPTHRPRNGWKQLDDIRSVRPGDVFAWLRPPDWPKGGNTGHVGIVVEAPHAVEEIEDAWAVRVVDASSYTHENDTRDPEGEGGWGMGTILFVTDDSGAPVAYGWFGTKSRWVHETSIVFGRVTG